MIVPNFTLFPSITLSDDGWLSLELSFHSLMKLQLPDYSADVLLKLLGKLWIDAMAMTKLAVFSQAMTFFFYYVESMQVYRNDCAMYVKLID